MWVWTVNSVHICQSLQDLPHNSGPIIIGKYFFHLGWTFELLRKCAIWTSTVKVLPNCLHWIMSIRNSNRSNEPFPHDLCCVSRCQMSFTHPHTRSQQLLNVHKLKIIQILPNDSDLCFRNHYFLFVWIEQLNKEKIVLTIVSSQETNDTQFFTNKFLCINIIACH